MSQDKKLIDVLKDVIATLMRRKEVASEWAAINRLHKDLDYSTRQIQRWLAGKEPKNPHIIIGALEQLVPPSEAKPAQPSEDKIKKLEAEIQALKAWVLEAGLTGKAKISLENVSIGKVKINEDAP